MQEWRALQNWPNVWRTTWIGIADGEPIYKYPNVNKANGLHPVSVTLVSMWHIIRRLRFNDHLEVIRLTFCSGCIGVCRQHSWHHVGRQYNHCPCLHGEAGSFLLLGRYTQLDTLGRILTFLLRCNYKNLSQCLKHLLTYYNLAKLFLPENKENDQCMEPSPLPMIHATSLSVMFRPTILSSANNKFCVMLYVMPVVLYVIPVMFYVMPVVSACSIWNVLCGWPITVAWCRGFLAR